MRFVSSAATVERDVDSGVFISTIDTFAADLKKPGHEVP